MTYTAIILAAAQKTGISGSLLLAVCTHESNLKNTMVKHDGGSPSYGICQVKGATAKMMGHLGRSTDLMNPFINAKWASRYLKYQLDRYDGNVCKAVSAYNAGTFNESKKNPGKPRNLKYVKKVQKNLDEDLKYMLLCKEEENL
jgi:soluble lytic murein transglycosylase-like protein